MWGDENNTKFNERNTPGQCTTTVAVITVGTVKLRVDRLYFFITHSTGTPGMPRLKK